MVPRSRAFSCPADLSRTAYHSQIPADDQVPLIRPPVFQYVSSRLRMALVWNVRPEPDPSCRTVLEDTLDQHALEAKLACREIVIRQLDAQA